MMSVHQPITRVGGERGARPPLIAHILFRFDYGGLENGIVNLINGLPAGEFDHAIIALTEVSAFSARIRRADVRVFGLNKRPGSDLGAYKRLWGLLRELRPAIVHTRNVGTLDCQLVAWLASVPRRIHGEHGWDVHDPDGTNRKFRLVRRVFGPLTHTFVTVSTDLEKWLIDGVGIPSRKVLHICNGVDVARFVPRIARAGRPPPVSAGDRGNLLPWGQAWGEGRDASRVLVGSVTRFNAIKDPLNLVRAFILARRRVSRRGVDLRLAMIGDGPLWQDAKRVLENDGEAGAAWLPGARDDVPALLRAFDLYALGSLREGISNTILEAMASGLPVIASATGGNLELVVPGVTGMLVPPGATEALADAIAGYALEGARREEHGHAARARVEAEYSLERMIRDYRQLYHASCEQIVIAA